MKRSIIGPLLFTGIFLIAIAMVVWAYSGNDSTSATLVTPTVSPVAIETPTPTPYLSYSQGIVRDVLQSSFLQEIADRVEIRWDNDGVGHLWLDGQPLNLINIRTNNISPIYYFSEGERSGTCMQIALAHGTILILKGYGNVTFIVGYTENYNGHGWLEFNIGNVVYVGNGNTLQQADEFYTTHNWSIDVKYPLN